MIKKTILLTVSGIILAIISCKSTRNRSLSKAVLTKPIDYGECDVTNDITKLCDGEREAMNFFINFPESNFDKIRKAYSNDTEVYKARLRDINRQKNRAKESGESTAGFETEFKKTITQFKRYNAPYINTVIYLKTLQPLAFGVQDAYRQMSERAPADAGVEIKDLPKDTKLSGLEQLKLLRCIPENEEDYKDLDIDLLGAVCEMAITSDEYRKIMYIRDLFIATRPDEAQRNALRSAVRDLEFGTKANSTELDKSLAIFFDKVSITHQGLLSESIDLLGARPISYESMVMSPTSIMQNVEAGLADLERSASELNQVIDSGISAGSALSAIQTQIGQLQIQGIDNDRDKLASGREIKRLESERAAKEKTRAHTLAELKSSRERIKDDLKFVVNQNLSQTVLAPIGDIRANTLAELPAQQISLGETDTGADRNVIVDYGFSSIPKYVANGVYYNSSQYISKSYEWLYRKSHRTHRTNSAGRSYKVTTANDNEGPKNRFERTYVDPDVMEVARVGRELKFLLEDPMQSVLGRYTDGFDGYVINATAGTGTSTSKKQRPGALGTIGQLMAAGGSILAASGVGTVPGLIIAGVGTVFSMIDQGSQSAYQRSSSTSAGVSFQTGYYHAFAKYPDIRLGQLVAEVGCDVDGTIKYNTKTDLQPDEFGILRIESFPKLFDPLGGTDAMKYRYAASDAGALVMTIPGACRNPQLRFVINDYEQGMFKDACLNPDAAENKEFVAIKTSQPVPAKACTFGDKAIEGKLVKVKNLNAEVTKALTIMRDIGIQSYPLEKSPLYNIAYSADPFEEALAYYKQQATSVTPEGIALVSPLIRNFVASLLSEKHIAELQQEIDDLSARIDSMLAQQTSFDDKSRSLTFINGQITNSQQAYERYLSLLAARNDLAMSAIDSRMEGLAFWGDNFFQSFAYHAGNNDETVSKISYLETERRRFVDRVRDVRRELLRPDGREKYRTLIQGVANELRQRFSTIRDSVVLQTKLVGNYTVACSVSLYHVYPNLFNPASSDDAALSNAVGGKKNQDMFLVKGSEDDVLGIAASYQIRYPFYYFPIDTNALMEAASPSIIGATPSPGTTPEEIAAKTRAAYAFRCSDAMSSLSGSSPRMIGIGVEILGQTADVASFEAGGKAYVQRSDIMSWYSQSKTRYYRSIDYSSVNSDSRFSSFAWWKGQLPTVNMSAYSTARCVDGAVTDACMKKRLGENTTIPGDTSAVQSPYRLTEYNTLLGNKWGLIIEAGDQALKNQKAVTAASNILVHFYFYKSRPLASVPL